MRVDGFLWLISIVVGPALGFVLIFTNFSLLLINVIGSLVFALMIPYVAIGHTLLYFDLHTREPAAARGRRSWRSWFRRRPRVRSARGSAQPTA